MSSAYMERASTIVEPIPPYDFVRTANYATYFKGRYGADVFEDGAFRRLLDIGGSPVLASVRSTGTVAAPGLTVELAAEALDAATVAAARRQIAWLLGTDEDLSSFYRMARAEPSLAPLVQQFYGLHIPRSPSVYEGLILAILGQQISSHVARILRTLLIESYGPRLEVDGVTYHAFPPPRTLAEVGPAGLRAVKCGAAKSAYIADIAARVASGELDLEGLRSLQDEEVVRTLTAIRGVGPWTAQWLFIRSLGHPDGFPHLDLALQRSLGLLVNGGVPMSAAQALEWSRRWSPHRSYVTTYLFAASRSGVLAVLTGAGS